MLLSVAQKESLGPQSLVMSIVCVCMYIYIYTVYIQCKHVRVWMDR